MNSQGFDDKLIRGDNDERILGRTYRQISVLYDEYYYFAAEPTSEDCDGSEKEEEDNLCREEG